jgi:hypothetical protein
VGERTKHFPIAVVLTMSGTLVAWQFYGLLWRRLSEILWCRLLLLLLAALWLTSLANVWVRAFSELRGVFRERRIASSSEILPATCGPREESDV